MTKPRMQETAGAPPAWLLKKTMIKDRIGTVRASSYDLPTNEHVFGKELTKDSEDAGVVMTKWVASLPSQPKESQRSFVKTNQFALRDGCITAKAQRHYAQENPDIRFKQHTYTKAEAPKPPYQGPYGIPTSGTNESIRQLIECDYTTFDEPNQAYPDMSGMQKKGTVAKPKPTKASLGHDVRSKIPAGEKEEFKMKKFQNVESKLSK